MKHDPPVAVEPLTCPTIVGIEAPKEVKGRTPLGRRAAAAARHVVARQVTTTGVLWGLSVPLHVPTAEVTV